MDHIQYLNNADSLISVSLANKLSGRYYTHETIARNGIKKLLQELSYLKFSKQGFKVIDPFGGDGRLICWLIEEWKKSELPSVKWEIHIWDIYQEGLNKAEQSFQEIQEAGIEIDYKIDCLDSFRLALENLETFDLVITNPPWEILKPDRRELSNLNKAEKKEYLKRLKKYDSFLSEEYSMSQPLKKFAGWGTNLSRVGLELCTKIVKKGGYVMVVLPASFLADDQSINLREHLFKNKNVLNIAYYPAEARLFKNADTTSTTLIFSNKSVNGSTIGFDLSIYEKELEIRIQENLVVERDSFKKIGYIVPVNTGPQGLKILEKLSHSFESWGAIEKKEFDELWAGREIDETGSKNWLEDNGEGVKFVKGRMIGRFQIKETPFQSVGKKNWTPPPSTKHERIVWRDVSRPSQKRRLIATIIPGGTVAGNSLGVCYYKDGDKVALRILLGIMSSLCFEFQLKTHLATGHVSLSSIRKVHIPDRSDFTKFSQVHDLVEQLLAGDGSKRNTLEAYVSKRVYSLDKKEFEVILNSFSKLTEKEKEELMIEFDNIKSEEFDNKDIEGKTKIPNHKTGNLSELDMLIVNSVPPGGNWKDLPEDIPSNRVKQIRESYLQGKGSRSTYYGRLSPDKPSYTINTYFNRPGNGCHIHYKENRVLSQREAARLQSFPDNFVFYGSQGSINNQIGNAVPPILAYQIALQVSSTIAGNGIYVDLFSGAGGLGLGFKWAGWKPILANDIEKSFLETYSNNVHSNVIVGSISDNKVFEELVERSLELKKQAGDMPFWVLGGPPCQGFSTAGNKRSMKDERNLLFYNYVDYLKRVEPDGFVFENVSGLLSMEKGRVYEKVKEEFKSVMPNLQGFVLNSENFAVPQRRKRVFLIGQKATGEQVPLPPQLTSLGSKKDLFNSYKDCVSVSEALSDLPELSPGQDGSSLSYRYSPKTAYQKLMRGKITPQEYLENFY